MRAGVVVWIALSLLLGARSAQAEDVAAADALFKKGIEGMMAGRYAEACAALAESHRLDPRLGALFTLAECRSKEGKIATAVALYDDYLSTFEALPPADQARQRGREKVAAGAARALRPHVPRLVLRLPAGVVATVKRDDVVLRSAALGMALPVDPGEHSIVVESAGLPPRRMTVTVALDEEKVVDLDLAPPQATSAPPKAPPPESPRTVPEHEEGSIRRPLAFAALGLGAAGIVIGAATGAVVLSKRSVVDDSCTNGLCTQAGLDAASAGKTLGAASTASFAIGGAALVASGVLFVVDRRSASSGPAALALRSVVAGADANGAFLGVRGAF